MYWVEEEVEVEYEKTASRTRAEDVEFQVTTNAQDALMSALDPLKLDMGVAAGGTQLSFKNGDHPIYKKSL